MIVVHLQTRALESGGSRTRKRPLILSPSRTYGIISDSSIALPTLPWYLVLVLYVHVRTNRTVRTSYKDLIPCTGEPCSWAFARWNISRKKVFWGTGAAATTAA